ncbi:MAG: DUF5666 domain-containing protein [Candidatus Acidiferrales bacterium]
MSSTARIFLIFSVLVIGGVATVILAPQSFAGPGRGKQSSPPVQSEKFVGTIKAISGNTITLAPDAGSEVTILVEGAPRLLRIAPGQRDLKNATAIRPTDLQAGDRILVFGKPSGDGKSIVASAIVAMKSSDVSSVHAKEREEWQRGVGGLVGAVDPADGTVTISASGVAGARNVVIHTSKNTAFRRYAPDSVKFDDAEPSAFGEIKPGDQLRARGTRNPGGDEFSADEIVSGFFRNISGTIVSVDTAANTIQVMDAAAKRPVLVRVTSESELRKLTPEIAERMAVRIKRSPGGPHLGAPENGASATRPPFPPGADVAARNTPRGSRPDFQQVLNRMPTVTLADLKKGDAVAIVSTDNSASGGIVAITLLAGVEPILAASPSGEKAITLSPWNLGGGGQPSDAGAP